MERNQQRRYSQDEDSYQPPSELPAATPEHLTASHPAPRPTAASSTPYDPPPPTHQEPLTNDLHYDDYGVSNKPQPIRPDSNEPFVSQQQHHPLSPKRLSKKWQQRLYWMVPCAIVVIVLCVLFEVYKSSFEKWVQPLANWLRDRQSWSWVLPVIILFILSFPPLFGHELVQIVVGLTYPLGVALGIACAGSVLGEAGCFVVFKYFFSSWVQKRIDTKIRWAAVARVAQQAGFRGVLVIRYSIVPPHLANPLFACTGMTFWLYMITVILSLPKALVFVALGSPGSEHSKGAKYGKVVAIGIVVAITVFASYWIRQKMVAATAEIEAERGQSASLSARDEEYEMLGHDESTEYRGAGNVHVPYDPVERAK